MILQHTARALRFPKEISAYKDSQNKVSAVVHSIWNNLCFSMSLTRAKAKTFKDKRNQAAQGLSLEHIRESLCGSTNSLLCSEQLPTISEKSSVICEQVPQSNELEHISFQSALDTTLVATPLKQASYNSTISEFLEDSDNISEKSAYISMTGSENEDNPKDPMGSQSSQSSGGITSGQSTPEELKKALEEKVAKLELQVQNQGRDLVEANYEKEGLGEDLQKLNSVYQDISTKLRHTDSQRRFFQDENERLKTLLNEQFQAAKDISIPTVPAATVELYLDWDVEL